MGSKATLKRGRRRFLGIVGAAAAGGIAAGLPGLRPLAGVLHAAPPRRAAPRTVVAIYLRGGADALNVVVPWADPNYFEMRPGIAIPAEADDEGPGVLKLDERFGLHPALSGLEAAWKSERLAPIVCVGSHHPTRSHFDAQDFMEYAAPGLRTLKEGWLNRYLQATRSRDAGQGKKPKDGLRALAMQKLLPRALRGPFPALAVPGKRKKEVEGVLDLFDDLYGVPEEGEMMGEERREPGEGAVQVGRDTILTLRELHAILETQEEAGKDARYPRDGFAKSLASIAKVIRADAGLEAACLDLGGWDTHVRQGGRDGSMAPRLQSLGDGLAAFARDLGPRLDDVLVLVMSEFGRTCRENGNFGTDHGHGGCMLALGGAVAGGRVHGRWSGLDPKKLYEGRDLPVHTDFRTVFREVLAGFLGWEPPKGFFPGYEGEKPLGLLS